MKRPRDKNTPPKPGVTPEEGLESILRRIRGSREFPIISKYLIEINQKLSDVSSYVTASELANTIMKDYALTNKLLKLVNSAFYGFMAGKVTTVTRAVILLGYENVRLAACSLVLFEHFHSKNAIEDLKDAVTLSFWCGVLARDISKKGRQVESEEAFICAMLHNLGRLLIIFHMPREYALIKLMARQEELDENKAAKAVLGISYSALGMAVAKSWGFPDKIQKNMAHFSSKRLLAGSQPVDTLHALTAFVNKLGHLLLSSPQVRIHADVAELYKSFSGWLGISSETQFKEMVRDSMQTVNQHAEALQLGLQNSYFLSKLALYCSDLGEPKTAPAQAGALLQPEDGQPCFHLTDIAATQGTVAVPKTNDPIGILMEGFQEVIHTMAVDPDFNTTALMSLEIIYRALKFNQVLLFIHDPATQTMEARYGYGCNCNLNELARRVRYKVSAEAKDIFDLAVSLSQDLIVENAQESKLRQMIPPWYSKHFNAPAFIFFPIKYKNLCLGALYADRLQKGPPISELEHRHVGMLRSQIILALKYHKIN